MMSSSSATVIVDKATSDLLIGPDWTMNLEICDSINSGHWQAKDVIKAVKKRLQHKNPRVQFLALTLLETMIKNCSDFVHFQVVDRGILQEMVKIVIKKTDMQVREKILVMLDSWQEAFGGPGGKYPQYYWAYTELKRSGVEFPKRSRDSALLFSTPASHLAQPPPSRYLQIGNGMPNNSLVRLDEAMATDVASLSFSDLDRFRGVMELLSDMLEAVSPSDQEAVKDEVIVDLVSQCQSNQKQLMQLVTSTGDEVLLAQALALNDDIQSLLAKNDAIASGAPLPTEASEPIPEPTTPNADTLALTTTQSLNIEDEEKEDEEDDDFAQLARRNLKNKQVAESTGSTSEPSSSSTECNALVPFDLPAPVKTSSKEQDMIDFLTLTLSSNPSPPHTPLTPPQGQIGDFSPQPLLQGQTGNFPSQPPHLNQSQGGNFTPQQPYASPNQGYVPYNSYVAPWAQPSPQQFQQQAQTPYNYPPPPWEAPNPFMPSNNRFPAHNNYRPAQYQQPQQQYNTTPFYSNVPNVQSSSASMQYFPANKMFDDLIDLKQSGASQGRGMSGSQK